MNCRGTHQDVAELRRLAHDLSVQQSGKSHDYNTDSFSVSDSISDKFIVLVASVLWRSIDLCESGLLLWENKRHVSVIILARSLLECGALLYEVDRRTESSLQRECLSDLNEFLVRCLWGSRKWPIDGYEPINVLTLLDKLNSHPDFPWIRGIYDLLSEIAHPNASGVASAYSNFNRIDTANGFSLSRSNVVHGTNTFGFNIHPEIAATYSQIPLNAGSAIVALLAERVCARFPGLNEASKKVIVPPSDLERRQALHRAVEAIKNRQGQSD